MVEEVVEVSEVVHEAVEHLAAQKVQEHSVVHQVITAMEGRKIFCFLLKFSLFRFQSFGK